MARPPAVARVLERVTATARAHQMFLPGETVLVAASGGPDSTCLLHALSHLRRLFRIKLEVFHLDHRLRPDSKKDADYVRRAADRLRLPFHLRAAESRPLRGESVEVWARRARMLASAAVAREVGAERIAEGHTLDDQAETVLMALVLGWGLDGLVGIRPVLGKEVQPLINVSRDEVAAFCRALRLRPREDPTNKDTRLLRNALRLEGIPALERATGRELKRTFARTADLLRIDHEELSRQAGRAAAELLEEVPEGWRIPAIQLTSLSRAIATRVVRGALIASGARWTQDDVEAVLDLAGGRSGRRRDLTGGLKASRDREYVRLSRASPESRVQGGGRGGESGRIV